MRFKTGIHLSCLLYMISCSMPAARKQAGPNILGTWRLFSGTVITKGVSVVTDYTKGQRMIKIVNASHFAFLKHNLHPAKDSPNHFDAGGGLYTLNGDRYTEHLDYYTDKNWENKTFNFRVSVIGDTLIQQGTEKIAAEGIERVIIEKYVAVK